VFLLPNRTVSAPVAPEDYEELRRLARADDRSVSSLIRLAIRNYIVESSEAGWQAGSAKTRKAMRNDPA
jgi:hypothetical protein